MSLELGSVAELDALLENLLAGRDSARALAFGIDTVRRYADQAGLEDYADAYIAVAESKLDVDTCTLMLLSETAKLRANKREQQDTTYYLYLACAQLLHPGPPHEWVKNLAHYVLAAQAVLDGGDAEQVALTYDVELAHQIAFLHQLRFKGD